MDYRQIKLVALDLDDTTLRGDSTLSQVTRVAIEAVLACGVEVVVASGRAYRSLPAEVVEISGLRYAITSNGAAIYCLQDGQRLQGFTLSSRAVQAVLGIVAQKPARLETFIDGVAYADESYVNDPVRYGCMPAYAGYVQRTRHPVADMRQFLLSHRDQLDSIDIICPTLDQKAAYAALVAKAAPDTYLTTSCRQLLEISDQRAGKGPALAALCQQLQLTSSQCMAFGNAENDCDMLQFAGVGVAVTNATPDCLAAADLIIPSNEEDGVALILQEIAQQKRR